jgi:hypothetical protein
MFETADGWVNDPQNPTAPAQEVHVGDTVCLHAPEPHAGTYRWAMTQTPSGSHCLMHDDGTPTPSFVADVEGEYLLMLEVDGKVTTSVSVMALAVAVEEPTPPLGVHATSTASPSSHMSSGGSHAPEKK